MACADDPVTREHHSARSGSACQLHVRDIAAPKKRGYISRYGKRVINTSMPR
jgi:hypothetical protein